MAGDGELNCLFLVTTSSAGGGGEKNQTQQILSSEALFLFTDERCEEKAPKVSCCPWSPSSFSGCRKVFWGGETRGTRPSPSILLLVLFPSPLLLEVGQQTSWPTTPTQASFSILGLPNQVNTDMTCFWGFTG